MDDDLRNKLMRLNEREMAKLAQVCSRYPNIDLTCKLDNSASTYQEGQVAKLHVTLTRPDISDG